MLIILSLSRKQTFLLAAAIGGLALPLSMFSRSIFPALRVAAFFRLAALQAGGFRHRNGRGGQLVMPVVEEVYAAHQ
jgi:hypothetical protein